MQVKIFWMSLIKFQNSANRKSICFLPAYNLLQSWRTLTQRAIRKYDNKKYRIDIKEGRRGYRTDSTWWMNPQMLGTIYYEPQSRKNADFDLAVDSLQVKTPLLNSGSWNQGERNPPTITDLQQRFCLQDMLIHDLFNHGFLNLHQIKWAGFIQSARLKGDC